MTDQIQALRAAFFAGRTWGRGDEMPKTYARFHEQVEREWLEYVRSLDVASEQASAAPQEPTPATPSKQPEGEHCENCRTWPIEA